MENESPYFGWLQKSFLAIITAIVSFGSIMLVVIDSAHGQLGIGYIESYELFCGVYFLLVIAGFCFWIFFFSKKIEDVSEHEATAEEIKTKHNRVRRNYRGILSVMVLICVLTCIAGLISLNLSFYVKGYCIAMLVLIAIGYFILWWHNIVHLWRCLLQNNFNIIKVAREGKRVPVGNTLLVLSLTTLLLLLLFKYDKSMGKENTKEAEYKRHGYLFAGVRYSFDFYGFEKHQLYHGQIDVLKKRIDWMKAKVSAGERCAVPDSLTRQQMSDIYLCFCTCVNSLDAVKGIMKNYSGASKAGTDSSNAKNAYRQLVGVYDTVSVKQCISNACDIIKGHNNLKQLEKLSKSAAALQNYNDNLAGWVSKTTQGLIAGIVRDTQNEGLVIIITIIVILMQLWLFLYLRSYRLNTIYENHVAGMTDHELKDFDEPKNKTKAAIENDVADFKSDLTNIEGYVYILALLTIPFFKSTPPEKINLGNPESQIFNSFSVNKPVEPDPATGITTTETDTIYQPYSVGRDTMYVLDDTTRRRVRTIRDSVVVMNTRKPDEKNIKRVIDEVVKEIDKGPIVNTK